ncbi:MAG: magnesium/cobalt transporter CorA [Saprospiraceae bacterium]|nr:magnesium/cobalt transporter CorA [Saprospiraceae bacterium]
MSRKKHKNIRKKGLPPGTLVYTGSRSENPSSVMTVWYNEAQYAEQAGCNPDWRHRQPGVLWLDVRSLSDTTLVGQLGQEFELHPLAIEDILDTQQRAKLEEYDNGLFFTIHNFRLESSPLELVSEQIALYMGPNFVLSFQEDPDDTFLNIRKRAQEGIGRLRKKNADYLTYALLDTIIDNYYLVLDDIENQLLDIETVLHNTGADASCRSRIFDLKHIIKQFRHRIIPLRDAVTRFYRSDCPFVDEVNRPYLRDLTDHVAQILDSIDNYRELLAGVESFYQAEVSNRMNNVMRLLTIISTIFIPLSFLAGVYGMNFDNMPELHWRYGYFTILGLMFSASIGMLYYFRRKRWL